GQTPTANPRTYGNIFILPAGKTVFASQPSYTAAVRLGSHGELGKYIHATARLELSLWDPPINAKAPNQRRQLRLEQPAKPVEFDFEWNAPTAQEQPALLDRARALLATVPKPGVGGPIPPG